MLKLGKMLIFGEKKKKKADSLLARKCVLVIDDPIYGTEYHTDVSLEG